MLSALLIGAALAAFAGATELFDRNLAYSSPFANARHLSHDTRSLQARHVAFVKRQSRLDDTESSSAFTDEHYPTFYGGDFSSSPWIYNGGINFTHSVASGDPLDNSVLLWTRAVPIGSQLPDQSIPVCISFKLFDNENLSGKPLDTGDAFTSYDVDFTLKVEAKNLKSDTKYWFQFADCTNAQTVSPVGTTRTISNPNTPANQVNNGKPLMLAVFSCSQYQAGWFNAYSVAAHNTSADIFVHLGDYIYESLGNGAAIGRKTLGRELATIFDYRQRLNQYRTDSGLVAAHQKGPWISVWDDHEVADQSWKAGTADANDSSTGCSWSPSGACFTDRKLAAVRAYHEWMPIRQVDPDDKLRIWRNFQIGKLLDLTMLDTRQYDRDITDLYYNTVINSIANEKGRSLMGPAQESWFLNTLTQSKARGAVWRVVGQQIVFTQLNESGGFDVDAWDGYRANRNRILDHLYSNKIDNTLILSGDSHANWVSDLAHINDTTNYDPVSGKGAIGVEFAGTAVTSSSPFGSNVKPAAADVVSAELVAVNTDLQWSEGSYRGFFTLELTPKTANATYFAMRNISNPNFDSFASATFIVDAGANKLQRPVAGGKVLAGALKVRA
ncbi:PhoD-like phosphatase-domain-containing protein [Epithele typhae]|uniref:PhoD-like phosphatase-domain-containing protein n=1 Tax=Epithele typhae TaxID=378194 RepID=UPI002007E283|nr:PhoD-like phosphatase-domain-containing protein [Epithele typhae]KAH9946357.1 PhoD-like phosphatase-domain-containing protein [Epithele typhae]